MKPSWKVAKPALVPSYTFFECFKQTDYPNSGSAIYVFCKLSLSVFMLQYKIPKNRCKMFTERSYNQHKYHYNSKFSIKNNEKIIMKRCYSTHRESYRWASFAPIFQQVLFGLFWGFFVALLKWDPWDTPAADRVFFIVFKKDIHCMDGQEQAMSDFVYWKTI